MESWAGRSRGAQGRVRVVNQTIQMIPMSQMTQMMSMVPGFFPGRKTLLWR